MPGQYIGVTFNYYTSRAEDGSTRYMSQYDYQDGAGGITRHSSMLQIDPDHKPTIEDFKEEPSGGPEKK